MSHPLHVQSSTHDIKFLAMCFVFELILVFDSTMYCHIPAHGSRSSLASPPLAPVVLHTLAPVVSTR